MPKGRTRSSESASVEGWKRSDRPQRHRSNVSGEVTIGQARKLVQGNSVSVNGEKVCDVEHRLQRADALYGRYFVLQKGKKNHHLIELEAE